MLVSLLFFLIFFSSPLQAVDPIIEVSLQPQAIGTNETAELRVDVINGTLKETPTPSAVSDNYSLVYRGHSSQRQIQVVNGTMEVKNISSYIFQLTPKKVGKHTVAAFIVTTSEGKQLYSPSTEITVENIDTLRPRNTQRRQSNNPFSFFFEDVLDGFLILRLSNNRVAQNTGVFADLYLYSNDPNFLDQTNQFQLQQSVLFEGGIVREIVFTNNNITTEQFGNDIFYGKIIKKFLLFPLETGTLELRPPAYYFQNRMTSLGIVGDPIQLYSYPLTPNLTYIGNMLDLSYNISSTNIQIADEIKLTLTIEGDGNVEFFANPYRSTVIDDVFISEPQQISEIGVDDDGNSEELYIKKTFEYTIIPRKSGSFRIPSIILNFADTRGRSTNTSLPEIIFNVEGNFQNSSSNFVKLDIPTTKVLYYSGTKSIIFTLFFGLLALFFAFLYSRQQNKLATDGNFARAYGAKKRLQKILKQSEIAIQNSQYKEAARYIRQSLLYFCADKFQLSNSSSPQEVLDYFSEKNIEFLQEKEFLDLMNHLDFYAFGSEPSKNAIIDHLSIAYKILDTIDKIK